MAVQELPKEQKEFIDELARFRNRLEPLERQILDSVVRQACEPNGKQVERRPADGRPSEDEVGRLVAKIEALEATLPDEQRRLLDEMLTEGSHDEIDVEAHSTLLWRVGGGAGPVFWAEYGFECAVVDGGSLTYTPNWWTGGMWGTYECWKW